MAEIKVGDSVPRFSLFNQDGVHIHSADLHANGPLVLFFYPKDDTPGCTIEACSFRDASSDFLAAGATVVGISSDSVASHKKFATKHNLQYTLLADEGGSVRDLFAVPRALFGLADGRVTYVIDKGGVVRQRFESTLQFSKHTTEALALVRSLKA
jgi:thioredoxin-dependent peroxiredoxin